MKTDTEGKGNMTMTQGVWKESYRSVSIYWAGRYHTGGELTYATLGQARAAIDAMWADDAVRAQLAHVAQWDAAKLRGIKHEDGRVTIVVTDTGDSHEYQSMRDYRRDVFRLEAAYNADVVFEERRTR